MKQERESGALPGLIGVLLVLGLPVAGIWMISNSAQSQSPFGIFGAILMGFAWLIVVNGFFVVEPNGSRVLTLFGKYVGTVRDNGFFWAIPFMSKIPVSLRARNLNGEKLKVNDAVGNPIEIAAIIIWRVRDTYQASFEVENYEEFVRLQSETAHRHLASSHPYDAEDDQVSLRRNTEEISDALKNELEERLARAGVEVLEARLSHLAYAPEIASAMLRRQQAAAVISARQRIVEGAVGMVEMAIRRLEERETVKMDDTRKAALVAHLLVVLCGEQSAQPVVNTGTVV